MLSLPPLPPYQPEAEAKANEEVQARLKATEAEKEAMREQMERLQAEAERNLQAVRAAKEKEEAVLQRSLEENRRLLQVKHANPSPTNSIILFASTRNSDMLL